MQLADGNDPFRESQLDSIIDKLLTLIYFVIVQEQNRELCEEWLHMSCEGYKTPLEGKRLCIFLQTARL